MDEWGRPRGGRAKARGQNEEIALRPLRWENSQEGDGVVALKAAAYFPWPESFSPEGLR